MDFEHKTFISYGINDGRVLTGREVQEEINMIIRTLRHHFPDAHISTSIRRVLFPHPSGRRGRMRRRQKQS